MLLTKVPFRAGRNWYPPLVTVSWRIRKNHLSGSTIVLLATRQSTQPAKATAQ
jgi:hypothetical protein